MKHANYGLVLIENVDEPQKWSSVPSLKAGIGEIQVGASVESR